MRAAFRAGLSRPVALVAAMGRNRAIGAGNALPWRLRTDLARFKALTLGHPLVMGRKTFESIGRPLPGRSTVVLSRRSPPSGEAAGAVAWAATLEDAFATADAEAARLGARTIFAVGGAEVYALALPFADRMHLTLVDAEPAGDAFFPAFDAAEWREVAREAHPAGPGDEHAFAFVGLERAG